MCGRANLKLAYWTATYVVIAHVLAWRFGFTIVHFAPSHARMYFQILAFGVGVFFLWCLWKDRPERPFHYVRDWAGRYRLIERTSAALPVLIIVALMLSVFGSLKSAIPAMNPYTFDPLFADIDEAIHGAPPWQLIHPIVGYPAVSLLLNLAYNVWFVAFFGSVVFVAGWIEQPELRERYLLSFLMCWILVGSVAAILTASVGPCFYDDFYGSQRFEPLMSYLVQSDAVVRLDVLKVQDWLLQMQARGSPGLGKGISAMPSVHVSVAVLMAILGWKVSRAWGIVATVYAALIFIGSIHLGYHYAIDGYVALAMTVLLWVLAGWKLRLPFGSATVVARAS